VVGVTGDGETATGTVPDSYDDYAATRADPRFTDWLRERAGADWAAATDHRFTRELGRGDLDDAVFRRTVELEVAFFDAAYDANPGEP
jgi:thiaminase/transcriptional activator TenA